MIMPIYTSVEKLDGSLIEAAYDLGARPARVFSRVVLPLTQPGIAAGILLVFVPAIAMFAITNLMGGGANPTIGEVIQNQFTRARNQPFGAALGVPLGALCARVRWVRDTLGVLALGLQTLPSVCWVPLALLWFGIREEAVLFVVVMGTLWAVVLAVQESVLNVPPLYLRAAQTMGSNGWHLWSRVILPAALPGVLSGMKQGWAFAWRSLMAAEIFVVIVTGFGLGSLLNAGRELLRMDQVMGVMAVVMIVGLLADLIFFSPIESWLRRSRGLER